MVRAQRRAGIRVSDILARRSGRSRGWRAQLPDRCLRQPRGGPRPRDRARRGHRRPQEERPSDPGEDSQPVRVPERVAEADLGTWQKRPQRAWIVPRKAAVGDGEDGDRRDACAHSVGPGRCAGPAGRHDRDREGAEVDAGAAELEKGCLGAVGPERRCAAQGAERAQQRARQHRRARHSIPRPDSDYCRPRSPDSRQWPGRGGHRFRDRRPRSPARARRRAARSRRQGRPGRERRSPAAPRLRDPPAPCTPSSRRCQRPGCG